MEFLAGLGGVAAASQLTGQALSSIYKLVSLYKRAKRSPQKVREQAFQLEQFKCILDEVSRDASLLTTNIINVLAGSRNVLRTISNKLSKLTDGLERPGMRKLPHALRAALQEPDLEKEIEQLLQYKTNLLICMQQRGIEINRDLLLQATESKLRSIACTSSNPFWSVPSRHLQRFVGRAAILDRLQQALLDTDVIEDVPQQRRMVLRGVGGQGKSQIAFELCKFSRQKRDGELDAIIWVDASSEATLRARYDELADLLGSQNFCKPQSRHTVECTKQAISTFKKRWLMVFDNYDDPDAIPDIESYIPESSLGSVLFTSRHGSSADLLADPRSQYIELYGLEPESACDLFLRLAGHDTNADKVSTTAIVHRLCYHPLAITQAAVFVRRRKIPLSRFNQYYDNSRRSILSLTSSLSSYRKRHSEEEDEAALSVFSTLELSYQQLEHKGTIGHVASKLLQLSSFIGATQVSEELFRRYHEQPLPDFGDDPELNCFLRSYLHSSHAQTEVVHTSAPDRNEPTGIGTDTAGLPIPHCTTKKSRAPSDPSMQQFGNSSVIITQNERPDKGSSRASIFTDIWSQDLFADSLTTLHDLSLLQSYDLSDDGDYVFSLHPLIADWVRLRCSAEQYRINFVMATRLVGYYVQTCFNDNMKRYEVPAAKKIELIGHFKSLQDDLQLSRYTCISNSSTSISVWSLALGRVYVHISICSGYAASVHEANISQALVTAVLPLSSDEGLQCLQIDSSCVPDMLLTLVQAHTVQGNMQDAERLAKGLVGLCQRCLGQSNSSTMSALFLWAQALKLLGRGAEAIVQYRNASTCALAIDEHHFVAIQCEAEEAAYLANIGQYQQSEEIYEHCMEQCRSHHSRTSAVTMTVGYKYACQLVEWGREQQALSMFRELAPCMLEAFGADNADTQNVANDCILLLERNGCHDEADTLRKRLEA